VYSFSRGSGQDTIIQQNQSAVIAQGDDVVAFGEDIDASQLWFERDADDLTVTIIGSSDTVRIDNWYVSEDNRVAQFQLENNDVLVNNQVELLVNAMAAFNPPSSGELQLSPELDEALAPTIAAVWQNTSA
jgi:hypothetical protein